MAQERIEEKLGRGEAAGEGGGGGEGGSVMMEFRNEQKEMKGLQAPGTRESIAPRGSVSGNDDDVMTECADTISKVMGHSRLTPSLSPALSGNDDVMTEVQIPLASDSTSRLTPSPPSPSPPLTLVSASAASASSAPSRASVMTERMGDISIAVGIGAENVRGLARNILRPGSSSSARAGRGEMDLRVLLLASDGGVATN